MLLGRHYQSLGETCCLYLCSRRPSSSVKFARDIGKVGWCLWVNQWPSN